MANFAYIKGSLASWANNTTVSQADFWQLDQNQKAAINGDGGGTWAPSSTITIGGSGLTLTSLFTAATATFGGNVNIDGNLIANVNVNLGDPSAVVLIEGPFQAASTADFNATTSIYGTFTVAAAAEFTTFATFSGTTTFDSPSQVILNGGLESNSDAVFNGDAYFYSTVTLGSGGQIPMRVKWINDTNATVRLDEYNEVIITALSDDAKIITLDTATAVEGSSILVVNNDLNNTVGITDTAGALSYSLGYGYGVSLGWKSGVYTKKFAFAAV